MAATIVIGCADQTLAYDLRSQVSEAADVEIQGLATSTTELTRMVVENSPAVVLVHDELGPEPVEQVIRDISLRRPGTVSLYVSNSTDSAALSEAMSAGARGVITYPLDFAAVQQSVTNAIAWAEHMEGLLEKSSDGPERFAGHASVVAFSGSKGGVGTSTIASHLAWDVKRKAAGQRVLLIDLDLEKGDVASIINARYRTSIADLAKVADDLGVRTVMDAIFEHESGLHLLLPPLDVRDVDWVTPAAMREILALLRQQYDTIIVDVGSHVTPLQTAIVEVADEVVMVVNPNLVSMRGARRNTNWWQDLSVRKNDSVHVLLNRQHRDDELQRESIAKLSPGPLLDFNVADFGRKLESASNSRDPGLVSEIKWWQAVRRVGIALNLYPLPAQAAPTETDEKSPSAQVRKGSKRKQKTKNVQQQAEQPAAPMQQPDVTAPVSHGELSQGVPEQPHAVGQFPGQQPQNPLPAQQHSGQGQPFYPPQQEVQGSPVQYGVEPEYAMPVHPAAHPGVQPGNVFPPDQVIDQETNVQPPSGGRRARRGNDQGSASVEFMGVLPWALLIVAVVWQLVLVGMSFVWGGQAASAAARATSIGQEFHEVRDAAKSAVPSGMKSDVQVSKPNGADSIDVSVNVPVFAPGLLSSPWSVDVSRNVVMEP